MKPTILTSLVLGTAVLLAPSDSEARPHRVKATAIPSQSIVAHPKGCPKTRFCGCGTALKVFGRHRRDLWTARSWLRFPKASPAPGMVAANRKHVFYILSVVGNNKVLAYDPNSGRNKTRIHVRSLNGFSVRNPHA